MTVLSAESSKPRFFHNSIVFSVVVWLHCQKTAKNVTKFQKSVKKELNSDLRWVSALPKIGFRDLPRRSASSERSQKMITFYVSRRRSVILKSWIFHFFENPKNHKILKKRFLGSSLTFKHIFFRIFTVFRVRRCP